VLRATNGAVTSSARRSTTLAVLFALGCAHSGSPSIKRAEGAKQAQRSPAAPVHTELSSRVIGVSRDGESALVSIGGYPGFQHPGRYRRIAVSTGETLEEWAAGSLPGLPVMGLITDADRARWRPPATLGADLARVGAQWATLSEARHHRFAASSLGVVFGVGDGLYAANASGAAIAPLSRSAAYAPEFSRDGRLVAWGEHVGRVPGGVGNYALHVASITDRRATRVAGSDETRYGQQRFSLDGRTLYFTARDDARRAHCLRRASISASGSVSAAVSIHCGADRSDDIELSVSHSRTIALVAVRHRAPRSAGTVDLHWIRLSDERVLATHTRSGVFVLGAVMDDGLLVARVAMDTVLFDPFQRASATIPWLRLGPQHYDVAERNASELIAHTRGGLRVIRPRQLFDAAEKRPM
jgi:hypothetical protein